MFAMILDKVYFFWAGTREGQAGAMWFSWLPADFRRLPASIDNPVSAFIFQTR